MGIRKRRLTVVMIIAVLTALGALYDNFQAGQDYRDGTVQSAIDQPPTASPALDALGGLAVKGRAPKTGYERSQFSDGWAPLGSCDIRNFVLKRDLTAVVTRSLTDCTVMQGTLLDPYTAKSIVFVRGAEGSDDVQIDHVVALSNAWQTGAQQLSPDDRFRIFNDPLNLLAVDGPTNNKKGDADAATWLPPNKDYRCRYVARQIAVKQKYSLWVTPAEHQAIKEVLQACPGQPLPTGSSG